MFFVEARYHKDPSRVGQQVRYIAHREEGLTDGQRRGLYGIGERYRSSHGDEGTIRKALREDGRGLRNPAYFRFILTVDNPAAERFCRLDGLFCERILRDAVERTFRGAARGAQGVFAIHQHGGVDRPSHPHVHALLSPRFENGMAVHLSPVRIQRVRERWEREVLIGLERQEHRLNRTRDGLPRMPLPYAHDRERRPHLHLLPAGRTPHQTGQLELFRTARTLRFACRNPWTEHWLLFGKRRSLWQRDPERAARRAMFRLASRALPQPLRKLFSLMRNISAIGRQR